MGSVLRTATLILLAVFLVGPRGATAQKGGWHPADPRLLSRWGGTVTPQTVKDRPYPRPQMKRKRWKTLNGLWRYALLPRGSAVPSSFDGDILVPFPVESALSGVGKRVRPSQEVVYRRTFTVPEAWTKHRVRLHFGAVDWRATVRVNGQRVGRHEGGYDPFAVDVTDALTEDGPQTVTVRVWDPTDRGPHPRGKQVLNPGGIWYTAVTGLWRTVWLEPVPRAGWIQDLTMRPDLDAEALRLTVDGRDAEGLTVEAVARARDGTVVGRASGPVGDSLSVPVPDPHLWSPSNPYLYDLDVRLVRNGTVVDAVDSYFGMRSIGLGKGPEGETRITLNGAPLFQYGPLDQGYWPGGLYTAPTAEAMAYDLKATKELGFNMTRKHVKVEPRRWYYVADSLGLLVWQDMPSALAGPESTPELTRSEADRRQFETELRELVDDLYNHPSIVMWIIFNEGWGQYETARLTRKVEAQDPTRLVSNASGWVDKGVGDVRDIHAYPGPAAPPAEDDRAVVLGEFGGRGLPIAEHTWQREENWGHAGTAETPAELDSVYRHQLRKLRLLIDEPGLSAAVYTQLTDVEIEVNGLLTYDRDVRKLNTHRIAALNRRLYEQPPPEVQTIAPTSRQAEVAWRYTTTAPDTGWMKPGFEAADWRQGPGGFGTEDTPGSEVGTPWTSSDLWVRRTFTYEGTSHRALYLRIHHDDGATVYLNGTKIAALDGWTTGYRLVELGAAARQALRQGQNTLAIHVRQDSGGQFLDAGLIGVGGERGQGGTP